jgi:ribosomal-protein-alanine N-acetyltransferase
MSALQIRPMTKDDCAVVAALEQACGLSAWRAADFAREMDNPQAIVLVAYLETAFAGYFSGRVMSDEFELFSIAVVPELRRQNIGQALVQAGLQALREQGLRRCFLEVRAGNVPAQRLYARNGFREVGRRRAYYQHPTEDAVVLMWEELLPARSEQ